MTKWSLNIVWTKSAGPTPLPIPVVPRGPLPMPRYAPRFPGANPYAPAATRSFTDRVAGGVARAGRAVVDVPVNVAKNWAGFGRGGNLEGVGILNRTASPVPRPGLIGKYNPVTRAGTWALRQLDDAGRAGHVAATALRAGKNVLTTNPVRPVLQAVSPRLGRHANKLTLGGSLAYGGYRGARIVPDRVDGALRDAGVEDEGVLDRQWWRTMKSQPKILWQSIAPKSMGGDATPVGKIPRRLAANAFSMAPIPEPVGARGETPAIKDVTDLLTKSPNRFLPTPGNAAKQTAIGNLIHNLHKGAPDVAYETAKQTGSDLLDDPEAIFNSPILKTIAETADPELWRNPDTRRAILASAVGPRAAERLMRVGPYAMTAASLAPLPDARQIVLSGVAATDKGVDAVRGVTDRLGVTDRIGGALDEAGRKVVHEAFKGPPGLTSTLVGVLRDAKTKVP